MQTRDNAYDLTALASSTRSLELECIRLRKTLSYIRRHKGRDLPIEEEEMREDIEREMALYSEQARERDLLEEQSEPCTSIGLCEPQIEPNELPEEAPDDLEYRLLFERDSYTSYLEDLKEELRAIQVQ